MSSRILGPSADLPVEKSNNIPKRHGARKAVPLLPGQQSKAERLAHGKNRVLQRRLQYNLDNITRDRRAWLSGVHTEVTRYRRRVVDLNSRLSDQQNTESYGGHPNNDVLHISPSAPATPWIAITPSWKRPATSLPTRSPTRRNNRPKTAGRQPLNELWKDSVQEKPLFRVRGNQVTMASSDDDNTDSRDDLSSSDDCDNSGVFDAVRTTVNSQQINRCQENLNAVIHKLDNKPGQNKSVVRTGSASDVRTSDGTARTSRHSKQTAQRCDTALRQHNMQNPQIQSARSATTNSFSKRMAHAARGSASSGQRRAATLLADCAAFKNAEYIRFVLDMERGRYELSQMKVKHYLQKLKI